MLEALLTAAAIVAVFIFAAWCILRLLRWVIGVLR